MRRGGDEHVPFDCFMYCRVVVARIIPLLALVACGGEKSAPPAIRFLHTFPPAETELINSLLAERGLAVDSALVPFARGQQVLGELLAGNTPTGCPDLVRIDATWLPGLKTQLLPVPNDLARLDWTPEAAQLATIDGAVMGVPQVVDGLLVVRDTKLPAPASSSIADLVAAARAQKSAQRPHPLGLRVDGYWLVPWLRAAGADVAPDAIAGDAAKDVMAQFAALVGDVAAPPPPAGEETPDEQRRWSQHQVAYWLTGTWQLGSLGDPTGVALSPLANAPRGGQLLVVPKCAAKPAQGWKLAATLTSADVELALAKTAGSVPTRGSVLAQSPALVRAAAEALKDARPLPRTAITSLLFDDLNPALAAVVAGDATAEEAIAGVRRGWARLAKGVSP